MAAGGDEGRWSLRKASVRWQPTVIPDDVRMGKPDRVFLYHPVTEYIGYGKRTRGTETSQYPEERTSTETPVVVASEPGPGQCLRFN